ncbi:Threonylcarbamoyladenosine tRNA methylthiotransferase [Blyttiomyces sp. JEL0837]|nr:Threonylcarbamoyladenosine tRNA methylthiotransferase [Blyttiomyces sp. JEL0837]
MMANQICGPYQPSEILIVLGGAKRAMSAPIKRVFKMLEKDRGIKVVRVDEFQTSQVCAHCMSAQRQCSHKITAIDCGIPSSEKIEKLGEYNSYDVDHVVYNGVLNLALLDIHSREFTGRSDKEIHYQKNDFSGYRESSTDPNKDSNERPKSSKDSNKDDNAEDENENFDEGENTATWEKGFTDGVFVLRQGDEADDDAMSITIDSDVQFTNSRPCYSARTDSTDQPTVLQQGDETVTEAIAMDVDSDGQITNSAGLPHISIYSTNGHANQTMAAPPSKWTSPRHSKWERVSKVPVEGAVRIQLDSREATAVKTMLRKDINDRRYGWKSDKPPAVRVGLMFGTRGYVKHKEDIWAVKRCSQCGMMWSRDVMAARNIGIIFLYMVKNGLKRPPPFQSSPNSGLRRREKRGVGQRPRVPAHGTHGGEVLVTPGRLRSFLIDGWRRWDEGLIESRLDKPQEGVHGANMESFKTGSTGVVNLKKRGEFPFTITNIESEYFAYETNHPGVQASWFWDFQKNTNKMTLITGVKLSGPGASVFKWPLKSLENKQKKKMSESFIDDIEDLTFDFDLPEKSDRISHQTVRSKIAKKEKKKNVNENVAETALDPRLNASMETFLPGQAQIWVKTWGCSHNTSDAEYMAGLLAAEGYEIILEDSKKESANVWLLNSCTVKGPSEMTFSNEVKGGIDRGKKVIVAGCVPQATTSKGKAWENLSVIGVQQIDRVVEVVEEALKGNTVILTREKKESGTGRKAGGAALDLPKVRRNPLVEIIPINTGCLNQCTYCKTKHARGNLGSYEPAEIWSRVEQVILEGVKEIWLTSEDTGAYGRDIGVSIVDLLWGIIKVLEKYPNSGSMLRIGMTNPPYILEHVNEMVKILSHPQVFSFLHVPVQAGSDKVLDDMRRLYTVADFRVVVDTLRNGVVGGCTIATDIICGFPTETDEDFRQTMALLADYKFSVLHISQFYPRPGTPAARLKKLTSEVVKSRSREVTALFNTYFPYAACEGQIVNALVTEVSSNGQHFVAHDKLYRQILVPLDDKLLGTWVTVTIIRTGKFFLEGELVDHKNTHTNSNGQILKASGPRLVNIQGKLVNYGKKETGIVATLKTASNSVSKPLIGATRRISLYLTQFRERSPILYSASTYVATLTSAVLLSTVIPQNVLRLRYSMLTATGLWMGWTIYAGQKPSQK